MSGLELRGISKLFGTFRAVDDVSLAVPDGRFVCLLGPSGCGKTTLLRMIAGLEEPSSGQILLAGKDLTRVPTHRRDLGMVFQSLALFPHLSVGDNMAYPLRLRGRSRAEQRARVAELLELVRLPGMAGRPVAKLSGGQRQRVAIARALALSPRLFLLDEPLSALDAKLREAMQIELRQLQQRLGVTTIAVTHDQREAMTMADLVVVMGEGRIRQAAPPVEIYRHPADSFVANFIGTTNLIPLRAGQLLGRPWPEAAGEGTVSIRPEDVRLTLGAAGPVTGRVAFVRDLGATIETFVEVEGLTLTATTSPRERQLLAIGDAVAVELPPDACVVLKA
ncbi:MAG TPA: ABC transporter ATP-binding protein [Acetobacteraceae bacterium]|nr:ABC transporter ATP-binding protein [Acetobacteraceae bacterium]